MIFNTLIFVVFFLAVLIVHTMPFSWRTKKVKPPHCQLHLLCCLESTLCDSALGVDSGRLVCSSWTRAGRPTMEAARLDAALGRCRLVILSYFKYGHFLLENFVHLAALAGLKYIPQR